MQPDHIQLNRPLFKAALDSLNKNCDVAMLSPEQIEDNARTIVAMLSGLLDRSEPEISNQLATLISID